MCNQCETVSNFTPEEQLIAIRHINKLRVEKEAQARHKALRLEILRNLYRFEQFEQREGLGLTYSTFCDDYEYRGENCKIVYNCIAELRNVLRELNIGELTNV